MDAAAPMGRDVQGPRGARCAAELKAASAPFFITGSNASSAQGQFLGRLDVFIRIRSDLVRYHPARNQGSVQRPFRVLLAKVGLDGHDRGVKVVARALRDAGMEVVYTGLHRRPEEVVVAAVSEDVDVIGVSILSGAHMTVIPRLLALMRTEGVLGEMALVAGGVIPPDDAAELRRLGVDGIVDQEATPDEVVGAVRRLVEAKRAAAAAR